MSDNANGQSAGASDMAIESPVPVESSAVDAKDTKNTASTTNSTDDSPSAVEKTAIPEIKGVY